MTREVEALIQLVSHHDPDHPDAAWQAAIALGEREYTDPEDRVSALTALLAVLRPPAHALTRAHAVEALGKLGDRRAVEALMRALNDGYYLVRAYAAGSLGQLGDERAVASLIQVLTRDTFFGARAAAATAIGRLCRGSASAPCQQAMEVLRSQRIKDESSGDERSWRVLEEIDRALGRAILPNQSGAMSCLRVIAEVERAIRRIGGDVDESSQGG